MQAHDATILVVDDDLAITFLLEELLADQQYHVEIVHTLAEASASIAAREPDVVILDVQLPDGNGFDFCARLHRDPKTSDLPILFLSAVDRSAKFVARGLNLGGYDFLTKPFHNDELVARVRVLVRLRKLQQRLIEQERDRAMLATAGAAAHNLGQPLMAALGLVKLLLQSDLSATQRQDMDLVYAALKHMGDIVRQIQQVQHYITQPYLEGASEVEILDLDQAGGQRAPDTPA